MGRKILETLTESMFYVLMALLRQARCGTEIADFVAARTKSRVRLGRAPSTPSWPNSRR